MASKWIQGVIKRIKKKGTQGAFRRYCGGKVTKECIERGKNSKDPTIRARAKLAETLMKMHKKEDGGDVIKGFELIDSILNNKKINDLDKYITGNKKILSNMLSAGDEQTEYGAENPIKRLLENMLLRFKKGSLDVKDYVFLKSYSEKIRKAYNNSDVDEDYKSAAKEYIDMFENILDEAYINSKDVKKGIDIDSVISDFEKLYNKHISSIELLPDVPVELPSDSDVKKETDKFSNPNYNFLPMKFAYGGIVLKDSYGKSKYRYDNGGIIGQEQPVVSSQEQQQDSTNIQQNSEQQNTQPQVTYEQYVSFVMQYPEYFQRLLLELQNISESNRQQTEQPTT